jgi:propionyl-CoA carboxylase alpha subunit
MFLARQWVAKRWQSSGPAPSIRTFNKVLVANRGEIACRVFRSAKKMGKSTVAVYSEADAQARHVREADEAVLVGGAASSDSYLRIDRVLSAIKKSGADAVHPGYGFLSENAEFVAALEEHDVRFIGPNSKAMLVMGDKIASKQSAVDAGVNVIPGFIGEVNGVDEAVRIANEIGYPVMMKASSGGGGKGMRVAWNDDETREGFALSRAEAKSSFGDDRMLIEKFIDEPRHIEIQVLADMHGNCVYLAERECSIQRRNQKVLEEAPSVFIDEETRRAMGEQAVALAKAVDYCSAGTVEMLVDSQRNFYFLEMNTRLQVEHPITEFVTNQDIVEHMIRVAEGHPLSITQDDVRVRGWATEARVYAEDPIRDFLPSIGRLTRYREPPASFDVQVSADAAADNNSSSSSSNEQAGEQAQDDNIASAVVRIDAGVHEGSEISMHYDPLVSKLITFGPTRHASIEAMRRALDNYVIRGLTSNIGFLRSVLSHPRYVSGNITTKFIEEEYPDGFKGHKLADTERRQLTVAAALIRAMRQERKASVDGQLDMARHPDVYNYHVRIGQPGGAAVPKDAPAVAISVDLDEQLVKFGDEQFAVNLPAVAFDDSLLLDATLDGAEFTTQLVQDTHGGLLLQHCGNNYMVDVLTDQERAVLEHLPAPVELNTDDMLISPMPGQIIEVFVEPGQSVEPGQKLAIIEAMKMRNVLIAPRQAIIESVPIEAGDTVSVDDILVKFEPKAKK